MSRENGEIEPPRSAQLTRRQFIGLGLCLTVGGFALNDSRNLFPDQSLNEAAQKMILTGGFDKNFIRSFAYMLVGVGGLIGIGCTLSADYTRR